MIQRAVKFLYEICVSEQESARVQDVEKDSIRGTRKAIINQEWKTVAKPLKADTVLYLPMKGRVEKG